ncbi:hypothetical protein OE88DRAFT_1654531 [Heliocybe sulcata]|uniref:Letm1 RBD domain-containing protein n=1 Tax=Heliocybe sulcata TaxID=5364 RepID=A0A5C3NKB3_9AGAM|nr:hypothetical protein OE88DRAFT_1654531 [Heliocybe sulcata]
MIRAFARNGLVERSITASQRSSAIRRPLGAPLRYSIYGQSCASDPAFLLSFARSVSTTSSSTEKPSTSSAESIQLQNSKQAPRKPKVDLKPAPVKPTKLPASPPAPAAAPPASVSDKAVAKTKDASSAVLSAAQLALKKADEAKSRDIAEATKHGILAPPPEGAGTIRRGIHQIWELTKFYGRGIKMVVKNSQRAKEMQKRVKEGGHPLSRWETRFIQTYRQDLKRLIPFLIIVLIIEEIVPLIAIYAPGMLPSTCILPSQHQRIQEKRRERLTAAVDANTDLLRRIEQQANDSGVVPLPQLDAYATSVLSTILNASSMISLHAIRRWRISNKLNEISKDDKLLIREEYGKRLTSEEVTQALEERGIVVANLKPADQARLLTWWLKSTADTDETDTVSRRVALVALAGLQKTGS